MMRTRFAFVRPGIAAGAALVLLILAGCSDSNDPFSYVKVSGKVTYEDGSLIPANNMKVSFLSETPAVGNRYPRPGTALIHEKTGEYGCPMSAKPGLVRGKHKVLILDAASQNPLPANLVPPEYADRQKTPLEVDTDNPASFDLKVHKPSSAASDSQPSTEGRGSSR